MRDYLTGTKPGYSNRRENWVSFGLLPNRGENELEPTIWLPSAGLPLMRGLPHTTSLARRSYRVGLGRSAHSPMPPLAAWVQAITLTSFGSSMTNSKSCGPLGHSMVFLVCTVTAPVS